MPGAPGYSQLKRNIRNRWHGNARGVFGSLEVNRVKVVLGSHIEDSLDKRGAVLRGDRRGEITGTSPSTDGDASHRAMLVSQLDKPRDVAGPRGVKAED